MTPETWHEQSLHPKRAHTAERHWRTGFVLTKGHWRCSLEGTGGRRKGLPSPTAWWQSAHSDEVGRQFRAKPAACTD